MNTIMIGHRNIGEGSPVFIVAELSANHVHKYDVVVKTIKAIKAAGADAVKIQTYTPDTLTIDCGNKYFQIRQNTVWDGATLYELYKKAYTPWEWHAKIKKMARDEGLTFFSTAFDRTAVDFLEKINVPAYKISSFEITDIPLIEYAASKGKPVILSTGIATLSDIRQAVKACYRAGNKRIVLLKCTSAYPTLPEEINLRTIPDLKAKFKTVVGFSDHTSGISAAIASVALGARVIEKHFILDKKLGGPDASFSIEPDEFKKMVKEIRGAEKAMGKIDYSIAGRIKKSRVFAHSLFAVKNIEKGTIFTEENIRSIRPGYGIEPKFLKTILGKRARKMIRRGTPLCHDHY